MAKNKTVSDSDTNTTAAGAENAGATAAPPTNGKPLHEGIKTFVYIGPALPNGRLKSNTILSGTYAEITEYYNDVITLYPKIARLIVPVVQLAESREKVQKSGNLLYNYHQEIAAAIAPKGEDE